MSALFGLVARFFRWWFGELAACIPAPLRRLLRGRRPVLALRWNDRSVTLALRGRHGARALGEIALTPDDPAAERAAVARALKGVRRGRVEAAVELPAERILRRTIDLPLAAAENLREVLGFEMDRHTPFRAEDVAFDYRVAARDRAGQRLLVDVAVAPRTLVDDVLRQATALGLPADRVGVAGDDAAAFDLLAADRRAGSGHRARRLTLALAGAGALLLGAAVLLPLQRQQDILGAYEARLADSRQKAAEAEALKRRLADSLGRNQFLASRRRGTPLIEALLNELTQRLADDTWLVQLRIADKDLSIAGYAPTASALIPVLEDSDYFADVRFSSPVMTDARVSRERFNLAAKITPPGS